MITTKEIFEGITEKIISTIDGEGYRDGKLRNICEILSKGIDHYHWVGFYIVDHERERELMLGPYVGEPTDHVRIPFGKGICGQAAQSKKTLVIQDVTSQGNYLSCNVNVRSEIVVPIFKEGVIAGELDIDSHVKGPFSEDESIWLEEVCSLISKIM